MRMENGNSKHERFMTACLRLAEKGRGSVSPNPLVGAVLVKGGRIVAQGYHRRFGGAHAEVECLRRYKGSMHSAALYVNLEPCAHEGKTPPCADLIIESGIRTVVVGMKDPNPLVNGRGIRKLRHAGIKVTSGILEDKARDLNRAFIIYVTKHRPFIHVKIAQTLDGKISSRPHSFTQITGKESQLLVHKMRSEHDAILVGAGTVRVDDPLLTVRLAKGKDPAVIVLDGRLSLGPDFRLWKTAKRRRVIVLTNARMAGLRSQKVREFGSLGVEILPISSRDNAIPLKEILKQLFERGIASVLVEAGTDTVSQFLSSGLVDVLSVVLAPRMYGSGVPAFMDREGGRSERFPTVDGGPVVRVMGRDVLLQYSFR